jgi:hypothetical protein
MKTFDTTSSRAVLASTGIEGASLRFDRMVIDAEGAAEASYGP